MGREADFVRAFVGLADLLIGEYDVDGFSQTLVDRCGELVGAAAVGMLIANHDGELRVAAASTSSLAELELLELQQQEGPCFEAARSGRQVHGQDLVMATERWPRFASRATELGLRSVHGFPLRVRDQRLGALNVFFADSGPFSAADLDALQALADLAAIGIAQQHTLTRRRAVEQEALAELAELSLLDEPLEQVFGRVRPIVVDLFAAAACHIHEHSAAERLVVRLGDGDRADALPADPTTSQAGHALSEQRSVVVEDLTSESRFRDRSLLEQGLVAGITAVIPGERRPFGTLSVHTTEPRSFPHDDVALLEGVATLLGSVIARRAAEVQLRQAQKLDAVGQLATGVAHDFNNLLQVIHGNAELLSLDSSGPQLRAILEASDQAQRLVSQLLTFSRQQPSERRSVDLNATVAAVTDMVDRIIGPDVSMELALTRPLPGVKIDPSQLEQVVMNLLVNARDAMPDGGTVSVLTREDGGPADSSRRRVRLVVSDTGTGMTDEVRARALEPFFTTKAPDRGTGMGLATVYGVVTSAGGTLDIDTAPGRGTSVIIDLPCAADGPDVGLTVDAGAPGAPTGRILVVDDEPDILDLLAAALTLSGHEVVRADSASEALDLLGQGPPIDLLLTDLLMPGMDGLELARQARQRRGSLPVLLMSGNALPDVAQEPDVVHLAKPFALTSLLDEISRMLTRVPERRKGEA